MAFLTIITMLAPIILGLALLLLMLNLMLLAVALIGGKKARQTPAYKIGMKMLKILFVIVLVTLAVVALHGTLR
ncbi:MAG: hypothetical protein RL150_687 [Candidatus Parcubacteria bacterium]